MDGKMPIYDMNANIYSADGEQIMTAKVPSIELDFGYLDCPLLCLFSINCFSEFTYEQKEKMKVFGEKCIIITDPNEFIYKIKKTAQKYNFNVYDGKVKYYTKNSQEHINEVLQNNLMSAFWKRDRYSYQNEYRILCDLKVKFKDHYILNIGSIRDITKVLDTNEILGSHFMPEFI